MIDSKTERQKTNSVPPPEPPKFGVDVSKIPADPRNMSFKSKIIRDPLTNNKQLMTNPGPTKY